jgi:predicted HicB family RNase H-like nuclease
VSKEIKQAINLNLNQTLWRKVKAQSALEGKSITQWLTELLEKTVGGKDG